MSDQDESWLTALDDADRQFIRRFILASGSLKAMAEEYGISYPTVRNRLDKLIAKVRAASNPAVTDPFRRQVHLLMADGALNASAARALLEAHNETMRDQSMMGREPCDT